LGAGVEARRGLRPSVRRAFAILSPAADRIRKSVLEQGERGPVVKDQGGGAFQSTTFGFQGRPSGNNRDLANVWDGSFAYQVSKALGANVYYGHAWGGGVITSIYPSNPNGHRAFLETVVRF
jgi:hypothetical protein